MNVRNVTGQDAPELLELWNRAAPAQGYAPLTAGQMNELIFQNAHYDPALAFVLEEEGLHGFGCAAYGADLPGGAQRGYLSLAVVDEAAGREGFDALLDRLEQALAQAGCKMADVLFFNPIRLPWLIPNTPGHTHNNVPGLWTQCAQHDWMLARGYDERARECAMYLPLNRFSIPQALEEKQTALARDDYFIEFYDGAVHTGLDGMLKTLGNPEWDAEISACARDKVPFLAAVCGSEVVGFAGPVYPEPGGRGYFTGIGVTPAHKGRGLGTLLFYRLCQAEKEAGARYMSLFTGEKNPARHIYERAGFEAVRTFGILRKAL